MTELQRGDRVRDKVKKRLGTVRNTHAACRPSAKSGWMRPASNCIHVHWDRDQVRYEGGGTSTVLPDRLEKVE